MPSLLNLKNSYKVSPFKIGNFMAHWLRSQGEWDLKLDCCSIVMCLHNICLHTHLYIFRKDIWPLWVWIKWNDVDQIPLRVLAHSNSSINQRLFFINLSLCDKGSLDKTVWTSCWGDRWDQPISFLHSLLSFYFFSGHHAFVSIQSQTPV